MKHRAPISGIESNREYTATAGYDNQLILWSNKDDTPIASAGHDHLVNQCSFSPCGQFIVTASSDYSARIFKVPNLELVKVLGGHGDDVEQAAFHPEKKFVATASRDHKIRVFDFDGNTIQTFAGHKSDVISVNWSQNGQQLMSTSDDGTLRIWTFGSAECKVIELGEVETDALAVFNDDYTFAGNDQGEIITIKAGKVLRQQVCFSAGIKRLIVDRGKELLLALSYDRSFKLFSVRADGTLNQLLEDTYPDIVWARSAAFSGTDILFATFGDTYAKYSLLDNTWKIDHIGETFGINAIVADRGAIWTVGDSGLVKKNRGAQKNLNTLCNTLAPTRKMLLTAGQSGKIFDALSGRMLFQCECPINQICVWHDAAKELAAVALYTGKIAIFEIVDEFELIFVKIIDALQNAVKSLSLSDSFLFAVGASGDACFIDLRSLTSKYLGVVHSKIANACANLSNDTFVSVSRDRKLRFICFDGSVEIIGTPHDHSIKSICVDPSKRWILCGSYFGQISIYDAKEKQWVYFNKLSPNGISAICFDTQSNTFQVASYNGSYYSIDTDPLVRKVARVSA